MSRDGLGSQAASSGSRSQNAALGGLQVFRASSSIAMVHGAVEHVDEMPCRGSATSAQSTAPVLVTVLCGAALCLAAGCSLAAREELLPEPKPEGLVSSHQTSGPSCLQLLCSSGPAGNEIHP